MRLFSLILFLFTSISLTSQSSTKWFVDDASWNYDYQSLGGPGATCYKLLGDTIYANQPCKNIQASGLGTKHVPMFERNDSVFVGRYGAFHLVYDFTLEVGDTMTIGDPGVFQFFVLDSLKTTQLFGMSLKTQFGHLIDTAQFAYEPQSIVVYERIGGPVLDRMEQGTAMAEIVHYLHCYQDHEYPFQLCNPSLDNDYVPFQDSTLYQEIGGIGSGTHAQWGIEYHIAGDTIIPHGVGLKVFDRQTYYSEYYPNDTLYFPQEKPRLVGILAQDFLNKKVWYKRIGSSWHQPIASMNMPLDSFILLYDFDLNVPFIDKVPFNVADTILFKTDTITLQNGEQRKQHFFFSDEFSYPYEYEETYFWIEGIGGAHGLFTSRIPAMVWDAGHTVNCVSIRGDLLYKKTTGDCQRYTSSTVEFFENPSISIFPNPASNTLYVEGKEMEFPLTIQGYSTTGKLCFMDKIESNNSAIKLSSILSNGIYYLRILDKKGHFKWKKLLIQR